MKCWGWCWEKDGENGRKCDGGCGIHFVLRQNDGGNYPQRAGDITLHHPSFFGGNPQHAGDNAKMLRVNRTFFG